ncbi:MAG: hypothetical protein F4Z01_09605 [Gammaproteobacteria bacterium]|nr:hypothetical protein [Gammaproteobacteria bacterium]MYF38422.1 hypothetical protein [Gammaproteobacteria bacterium]
MANLLKIFIAPGAVFSTMKDEVPIIQPLLALILCVGVFSAIQPLFVSDSSKMTQEVLEFAFETLSEQGLDVGNPERYSWNRTTQVFVAPVSALIWLCVGVLILSTYFQVTGNSSEVRRSWPEWFGFTLWSMMPLALYYFLFAFATLVTGEISPKQYLTPLAWVPGMQDNAFAVHITFGTLWAVWIQTVGLHHWTERTYPICLIIVLVPWLLQLLIATSLMTTFSTI